MILQNANLYNVNKAKKSKKRWSIQLDPTTEKLARMQAVAHDLTASQYIAAAIREKAARPANA